MKNKSDTIRQKNSISSHIPDLKNEDLRKDAEKNNEDIKATRHWAKRLAKRNFHPDGPGGGYDGL
jgi:hypothetical protein